MARSYGNIMCAIWDDELFCSLGSDAQRTYLMLVTQAEIAACGVIALTLKRWAKTLPERDRARLGPSLAELVKMQFILIDDDSEELFVRSFPRYDGGYKHAVRVKAVRASAVAVRSRWIRAAVALELKRLGMEIATEEPLDSLPSPTREPLERHSIGTEEPVESLRSVVTKVSTDHTPQTALHEPHSDSREGASATPTNTPPRCPKHQHLAPGDDPPCRDCKAARETWEAQRKTAAAAAAAARENCTTCHGTGWIEDDHGQPVLKCTHDQKAP